MSFVSSPGWRRVSRASRILFCANPMLVNDGLGHDAVLAVLDRTIADEEAA